ncbi:MAG: S26 family signal peptidase [Caulobacteraceae bacterium]|nr:S26 family signal peptidase [Caulobacteraceae bacterium]
MSSGGALAVVRWGRPPARRRRRTGLAAALAVGLIAAPAVFPPTPRLVWNASASVPIGLYALDPHARIRVGDLVAARTPASVRRLAAARRYLPEGVPLVKRVAAAGGQTVCAAGPLVSIDGRPVARRRAADRLGRPLPWWTGCRRLNAGMVFLLMADVPDSFDSRYFGPVEASAILGRATPLWVR